MPTITFITADGNEHEFAASVGVSLMQVAVDNGIDAIVAECGGACSCATCHCYVDDAWIAKIGGPDEIEHAMLDCVLDPQPNSRLSCQIVLTEELDGLVVRFPESQY
jgi:2Fe-2S ferredoxin